MTGERRSKGSLETWFLWVHATVWCEGSISRRAVGADGSGSFRRAYTSGCLKTSHSRLKVAGNEGANEQVPEGKSEWGSTGNVGVQTRSRTSSSNLKQSRQIKSGGKRKQDTDERKPAPDENDNEEENDAHAAQEATPKKSNRGPGVEIMRDKSPTGKEDSHFEGNKPGR